MLPTTPQRAKRQHTVEGIITSEAGYTSSINLLKMIRSSPTSTTPATQKIKRQHTVDEMPSFKRSISTPNLPLQVSNTPMHSPTPTSPTLPPTPRNNRQHAIYDDAKSERGLPSAIRNSQIHVPPPPTKSKRQHAIEEVLTSERCYASDMALVRDVHIPLALGEPVEMGAGASASRIVMPDGEVPMSREDARIVFGNIAELAQFTDDFCDCLEDAIEVDCVGRLFQEVIPEMERPYKYYISRHDTASQHLQSLPSTPALKAYHELARKIASDVSHAWDLHSMLIKPVQRLLKYPLLLSAILDATPDDHPDKDNLRQARNAMQEVAQRVNEERRRTEVVKDVLKRPNKEFLVRIKSIRKRAPPPDSDESLQVDRLHKRLLQTQSFTNQLTQNVMEWSHCAATCTSQLHRFALSFSRVIGLDVSPSESFNAFLDLINGQLVPTNAELSSELTLSLLSPLSHLLNTFTNPLRLIDMLNNTLLPMHSHLIHMPLSQKNRPPSDLLKASAEYLALRAKLAEELPTYIHMAETVLAACILRLARVQASYFYRLRKHWMDLWQALVLEGEDFIAGDTTQVWWERWEQVDKALERFRITAQMPKRAPPTRRSSSNSMPRVSSPLPLSSSASMRSRTTKSSVDHEYEFDMNSIGYDYASKRSEMERAESPLMMEMPTPPPTYYAVPAAVPITPAASLKIRTRPGTPTPSIKSKSSSIMKREKMRPLYVVYGIQPFEPPVPTYIYDSYAFLELAGNGEFYEVLKECGHPRTHEPRGLRLVLADDDPDAADTLLLVRRGVGGGYKAETGWALASYLQTTVG
ncbi:hypothetical protein BDZ89DRAFT_1130975 [Hymenopellis radicata]|nr:hypothetical protein BDZ89DRAFT_1130975 [Hymenopellis radicata]